MKILFFLKSRITEAMREYFVLCFQKDSGQRLSPKHLEARRHRLVLLGKHITLSHGHCMNAVLHERMPALRLLCAICNGNRTHSQCVSPGKKKLHHSLFMGETSTAQMWEKRASRSWEGSG